MQEARVLRCSLCKDVIGRKISYAPLPSVCVHSPMMYTAVDIALGDMNMKDFHEPKELVPTDRYENSKF